LTPSPTVTITMELDDLHAENAMYDSELKRRIDAQRYPTITGTLTELKDSAGKYTARGDLNLHGKTSTVDGTATLRVTENGLEASGELDLDIRDFGLTPPRMLMLRVYPEVYVEIELVAEPE
jgi:polyisoprenoid-binding protein YceI